MENKSPNYERAKQAALALLDKVTIEEDSLLIPISKIVDVIGVKVFASPDIEGGKSGLINVKDKEIIVNSNDTYERQRFTIAHEIGHFVLHGKDSQDTAEDVLYREPWASTDYKEQEANCFAANLIVPEHLLRKYYLKGNIENLAKAFGMSVTMMGYRIAF
ncbi:MAG: ImmA/IrrE family metallo-endopeptidase [Alphaproteobacteria bacterium]